MSRLVMGMFGSEFNSKSPLFGLACGQMRGLEMCRNAGWYNKQGEKLGWGDLSVQDIKRIMNELQDGELFVILPESASFWNFVRRPGVIGSMSDVDHKTEYNPGVKYIAKHCMYIVAPKKLYYTEYSKSRQQGVVIKVGLRGSMEAEVLYRENVESLLKK